MTPNPPTLTAALTSAISLFAAGVAYAQAADRAWSYTMEELYDRASAYKQIVQRKVPKEPEAQLETSLKAAEFKGYVAGILDKATDATIRDCTKRLTVTLIAARAASAITSVPLNRAGHPSGHIHLAIYFACDESQWEISK